MNEIANKMIEINKNLSTELWDNLGKAQKHLNEVTLLQFNFRKNTHSDLGILHKNLGESLTNIINFNLHNLLSVRVYIKDLKKTYNIIIIGINLALIYQDLKDVEVIYTTKKDLNELLINRLNEGN